MVVEFPRSVCSFYRDLYQIVDDPSLDPIISWGKKNKSFIVWDVERLSHRDIIVRFCCNNFSDFIAKLKSYGIVRIKRNVEQWEFGHKKYFVRGKTELLWKLQIEACSRRMKKRIKEMKAREDVENGFPQLRM